MSKRQDATPTAQSGIDVGQLLAMLLSLAVLIGAVLAGKGG